MADAPLKQLGKYEITGVLGQGAMGVVYRAFDPVLNRFLAIKVMSTAIATDGALRERFLREARTAGSLQHPNVVTIFDFGEVDGYLFIAMEFIDGVDLGEIMQHPEQVPISTRLDIVIEALNGLAYAHARGLVHRDIKPANIRVTTDHHAKIMDFGIARVESSELTQTGVMLGTPQYMSPEQVMGGAVTPASDVFSMGAVLYEFLTGVKPFHGETLHAVLFNVVSENPRPIRELMPGLPPITDTILINALAKEPADRYHDAAAMAKDLAALRVTLTGSTEADTVALTGHAAALRSHATTAVRDPQLRSFIKRQNTPAPVPAPARARWALPATITVVAAAIAIWFGTRRPSPAAGGGGAGVASVSGGASGAGGADSGQPQAPAVTPAAPAPGGAEPTPTNAAASRGAPPTDRTPPRTSAPSASDAQADSALRALMDAAARTRQRAQDAGATPADLATGDSLRRAAVALGNRGQRTAAAVQLSLASERWADAERAATAAAGRTAARAAEPPAERTERQPVVTQPTQTLANPPAAAKPDLTPTTAADQRREIEAVVAAYERALESRDVHEIRRTYPGLTSEQEQGWQGFFKSVRNFKATLVVNQVAVTGEAATAVIGALYEYDNQTTGRADRQQLRLEAALTRAAGAWQLASIR